MKRVGPELKLPNFKSGDMKVPPFLSDLFFDLRDRRLLPVMGLILVAIVATPILLAGSSEPEAIPAPEAAPTTSTPSSDTLTVVKAEPGLRNYKKRLSHRSPTNPFKQRFTGPTGLKEAELNEPPPGGTGSPSPTESTGGAPPATPPPSESTAPAPSGGGGGGESGGQQLPPGLTTFTYAADIQITKIETKPDGTVEKTGPVMHKEVVAPTPLPGEKAPVVTYLGAGAESHLPLFLVSPEVTAVFGEGECVAGTSTCQLLALEPKFAVTLEYGPNHVRYKINVVKIKPVVSGKT